MTPEQNTEQQSILERLEALESRIHDIEQQLDFDNMVREESASRQSKRFDDMRHNFDEQLRRLEYRNDDLERKNRDLENDLDRVRRGW